MSEDNDNDNDDDDGEMVDGEGNDVYVKDIGVGGEVKGVCGGKVEGVGGCRARGFGGCKVENAGRSNVAQTFDGEVERLKKLIVGGVPLHEPFLDFGPAKLTAKDIWSIFPPQEIPASQVEMLKNIAPGFVPGWLSDMVS